MTHRGALCYGVTATQTPGRHFPANLRVRGIHYPADRDFKGHVGGVRGAAPQGFFLLFSIFFEFFCQIFKEKKGDVLTNI